MKLTCDHIGLYVKDLDTVMDFYVNKLGLELIDNAEYFFAVKAGNIKFSFSTGEEYYKKQKSNINLMLKTENLEKTRDYVVSKGIKLISDITEVNNYKFFTIADPEGNKIHIGL